jgi:hypothetical protein
VSTSLPLRRVSRRAAPRYPDLHSFLLASRRAVVGAGFVTVAISLTACQEYGGLASPGSDTPYQETGIMGDMEAPAEDHPIALPETGSHDLVYPDDQGAVGYHVQVRLESWTVLYWFEDHADAALEAIDAVLLQHELSELASGGEYEAIELEIHSALELLFATLVGDETDDLLEVQLTVDTLPA